MSGGKHVYSEAQMRQVLDHAFKRVAEIKDNMKREREELKDLKEIIHELTRLLKPTRSNGGTK